MQRSLGNDFNCQSETPRLNVSNVIFTINEANKYYKYIKAYVLRCITIRFKQKYGHRSSRHADMNMMNLRCKSVFTAEIGQYWVVGRRSWYCVNWLHSCSYFYIKHHTIEKYLIETSNQRCIFIVDESLSDCAIRETWDQCRKWHEKTFFTFDFHISS